MQLHELGLPLRIPSESAVRGVLSRGQHYDLNARHGKRITIALTTVDVTQPGQPTMRMTEELTAQLLTVSSLAAPGETWEHPDPDDGALCAHIAVSWRTARVLARILSVRAHMRTEMGM